MRVGGLVGDQFFFDTQVLLQPEQHYSIPEPW